LKNKNQETFSGASFHALQFLPNPQEPSGDACNGSWRIQSRLVAGRDCAACELRSGGLHLTRERRRRRGMEFQVTLIRTLVALVPACMLFSGSLVLFFRGKTVCSFLQLLGAGCLVVVVLTHVSEALHLFPWMHWGLEHSAGHYLDLWSAVLGLTLFPVGYLFHALNLKPN